MLINSDQAMINVCNDSENVCVMFVRKECVSRSVVKLSIACFFILTFDSLCNYGTLDKIPAIGPPTKDPIPSNKRTYPYPLLS